MRCQGRLRTVLLVVSVVFVPIAEMQRTFGNDGFDSRGSTAVAHPWQDDATLRDVATVGEKLAWSVGDHGAVWQTTDGGQTWRFVPTPASASKTHWSSVCFLSDRVGWIAGGDTEPFTRRSRGALLVTKDGGASWQSVSTAALPRLRYVRFFDTKQGVVIGDATSRHPTGALVTNDGGKTWLDVVGEPSDGWLAADFLGPHEGLLGGPRGKVSVIVDQRLLPTRVDPSSWRRIRGVRMQRDLTGWLVGDGGLVLKTETGGVTWDVPAGELPGELRDIADFRAVAARGERVWLSGSPGSVIWHSPDGGQTWTKQPTHNPVPIESLKFASDRVGLAVGEFGRILRTIDGGETWEAARGHERRAAWMSFHLWPEETSCGLIAQQTGEAGYRNVASVLVPSDPSRRAAQGRSTNSGQAGSDVARVEQRLLDAVLASGGHALETDERWLISLPDIERQPERLLDAWSKRAEGRFDQVLQTRLVVALRTWRPDVIVLGNGGDSDEVVRRWREAVLQAVDTAADPTQSVGLQEMFGLSGWKVKKVYERRFDGSAGDATVDPHELLPRLRATVSDVAASAASRLIGNDVSLSSRHQAYRLLRDETSVGGAFLRGIAYSPGSAARRQLLPLDERDLEQQQKLARRQKNFTAVAERALDNEVQSAALVAELRGHARELSPSQAALELSRLVRAFRDRNQQDLAEATLVELINRYPNEPPALTAAAELIQYWSSAEIAWQRVRRTSVRQQTTRTLEPKGAAAVGRIVDPSHDKNDKPIEPKAEIDITDSPLEIGRGQAWQSEQVEHWQQQAIRLSQRLGKLAPELAEQPAARFPIAALLRQRELPGPAQGIARPFAESPVATPWRRVARRELWLVASVGEPPNELIRSVSTSARPHLDGLLSDECWVAAGELRLRAPSSETESRERSDEDDDGIELIGFNDRNSRPAGHQANSSPQTLAMISHDAQFLFFAASIPHHAELPSQEPIREGRTHDMDLSGHDRIALFLDIDRDYAVSYAFEIDQRGCTREACGDDITFNPKWYVATSSEQDRWRVEIAIPLNELAPEPLRRNAIWSVGIVRTLPGIGAEGWPATGDQSSEPSWRGLLKLE